MIPKYEVATACFSCRPPGPKFIGTIIKAQKISFQIMKFTINSENQNFASPCLKSLLLTIQTSSSLSYCPYQKDERAKPGNFHTKLGFPPPPKTKCFWLLTWLFPFTYSSTLHSYLSVSHRHHSDPACRHVPDTATVSWVQSKAASAAPSNTLQGSPPAGTALLCKCSCVIRIYEQPNPHTVHHQGDHHPPTGWTVLRNWQILAVGRSYWSCQPVLLPNGEFQLVGR
jgi:hypothetical protein